MNQTEAINLLLFVTVANLAFTLVMFVSVCLTEGRVVKLLKGKEERDSK